MGLAFAEFGLHEILEKSLDILKFETPTPIQAESLPVTMKGQDLIGCAQTGSGKTFAFCLPLVQFLLKNEEKTALILVPTRELAEQVGQSLHHLIRGRADIRQAELIGGKPMQKQLKSLSRKPRPRIVIATPGRLNDILMRGSLRLNTVGFLVLDEADRMLDMGFLPQIKKIITKLPQKTQRQTLMFSATMPKELGRLADQFLSKPERITLGKPTGETRHIEQSTVKVTLKGKRDRLVDELNARKGSVIVFAASKHRTDKLAGFLRGYNFPVSLIHGNRTQAQRSKAMKDFRSGKSRILVATDIASRGIDVPEIQTVINFDLPRAAEDYTHRIGRTARAGAGGASVTFLTAEDGKQWKRIVSACRLPSELAKVDTAPVEESASRERPKRSDRPKGAVRSNRTERPKRAARPRNADRPRRAEGARRAERFESNERAKPKKRWADRSERFSRRNDQTNRKPRGEKPSAKRSLSEKSKRTDKPGQAPAERSVWNRKKKPKKKVFLGSRKKGQGTPKNRKKSNSAGRRKFAKKRTVA